MRSKINVLFIAVLVTMSTALFASSNKEEAVEVKKAEVVELTIFESIYKPFDTDYKVFNEATKYTNVKLKGVLSQSSSDNKQAFNLMVASGEIADIVVALEKAQIDELALEGAFQPLDDLIKQHAPNLQAFLDNNADIRDFAKAADGKIYHIPFIPDGKAAKGWYIRTDWLKKLNLEIPTNADELYTVLKAFADMDPNGNGQADEIPLFNRAWSVSDKLIDLVLLFGANDLWYVDNGVVKYGPVEKEYKGAYKELAKWYADGLIDPEIYTRGPGSRDEALMKNIGGLTHDWFGSTAGYNSKVDVEGFSFEPFIPPQDVNGKILERTSRTRLFGNGGWAMSASNQHQVETIKYFDFFFSEEGRRLMNFGIEGDTYTMVDGKPIFTAKILDAEAGALAALREYGCQLEVGVQQDFEYEKQWMNTIARDGVVAYVDGNYFAEPFPHLVLTPEEKSELAKLMVAIQTTVDEARQKWVLGSEDIDSTFDDYLKSLDNLNIKRAIAIQQAAYDRM